MWSTRDPAELVASATARASCTRAGTSRGNKTHGRTGIVPALQRAGPISNSSVEQGLEASCSAGAQHTSDATDGSPFSVVGGHSPTDLARGSPATPGVESGATHRVGDALEGAGVLAAMTASASEFVARATGAEHSWRRGGGRKPAGASSGKGGMSRIGTRRRATDPLEARECPGPVGRSRRPRRDELVAMAGGQRSQRCDTATDESTFEGSLHGGERRIARSAVKRHEPQGRQRDATSPRRAERSKPSRW